MTASAPIVSVCMITYNHEKFISEAIEGVLMQEIDFKLELVIADDCSEDRTKEIVQSIIDTHHRGNWIKYTRHSANKGMMANFFWALKECQGKYVALCEGDDKWIFKKKLSFQIDYLEKNPNSILSFHDCNVINYLGLEIAKSRVPLFSQRDLTSEKIRYGSFIPTSTIVFQRLGIPESFDNRLLDVFNGDTILLFFLSFYGSAHFHNEFIGSSYRKHEGGVWSFLNEKEKQRRLLYTYEILRRTLNKEKRKYLDHFLCFIYYETAKKEKRKKYFLKAIRSAIFAFNFRILVYSILKLIEIK